MTVTREKHLIARGFVLAGGASSRFGSDKALARIGGQTLLELLCDLVRGVTRDVTVVAQKNRYSVPDATLLDDRWPGDGPLGGILTALHATAAEERYEWSLILSCDMPFLKSDWLAYMIEHANTSEAEVAVPRSQYGLEPLCTCWRTSAMTTLQIAFDEGVRKVTEAMKRLRVEVLDESHWKRFDTAGHLFRNMNTQQDYEEAVRVWKLENE